MKVHIRLLVILLFFFCTSLLAQSPIQLDEITYISEPDATNRPIDKTKPVSAIPASININEGMAHYNIPVQLTPGINNMVPSLSFGYNSSGNNGIMGLKWNLNAISSISRVSDNILADGAVNAPALNNSDNISLDGQRLILYSGSQLTTGSEYRTLVESHQRVEMTANGGFLVTEKNGLKKYYGESASHRLDFDKSGNSVTYVWLLEMVEDQFDNRINYHYLIDQNDKEYVLDKITYADADKAEVKFRYSNRTDTKYSYFLGNKMKQSALLKEIKV